MSSNHVKQLFKFIENSPSCFHAIKTITEELKNEGFVEIKEKDTWQIEKGKKYYVTRNLSSVIAFKIPQNDFKSFHIVASHSDSPTFKIKENAEIEVNNKYVKLNTEKYNINIKIFLDIDIVGLDALNILLAFLNCYISLLLLFSLHI